MEELLKREIGAILNVYEILNEQQNENGFGKEHEGGKALENADEGCELSEYCFAGFLKFSDKEIRRMPKNFIKSFRAEGCTIYYRERRRAKNGSKRLEARYRRHGYNISVSGGSVEELKENFIKKLHKQEDCKNVMANVPSEFLAFSEYYFKNYYVRKVVEKTYITETGRFKNHIAPHFGRVELTDITPLSCQELIDKLQAENKLKTAQECKSILNGIFNYAIRHGKLKFNPLDLVFYEGYEAEHGIALTKEQEARLLSETAGTPYQLMFAVALYTGLRPNEYESAHIEGEFIVALNSKQKDKRKRGKVFKRIPITPMLAPFVKNVQELKFYVVNRIGEKLRAILSGVSLKDLRTTFYTRCQECGISELARSLFMGHALGGLKDTYTDMSDGYLIAEGKKLRYDLPPILPPN